MLDLPWRSARLPPVDVVDTAAMAAMTVAQVLRRAAEAYAEYLVATLGDQLLAVVLFGSVARGDAVAGSDVDLLIVARDLPAGQFARKRLLAAADAAFEPDVVAAESRGVEVRLARIVRTPEEAARIVPLYLDMTEDAVLLVDRGGFFAGVLDRLRASLRRSGAKRVRLGATWYWDLKPDFVVGDVVEL
jgi:predicted nucleotidyltransferase